MVCENARWRASGTPCGGAGWREKLIQSRSDEEIRRAVKDALFYDPRVHSFQPVIEVEDGTVTLTGVVDNLRARRAAGDDARNVVGVRRVKNHLKVRPAAMPPNEELEEKVEQALIMDPYLELWQIDVNAFNGTVYLSGNVDTSFERRRAEDVAEGLDGVSRVINNLAYQHLWTWKPDWQIREDVEDRLFWNTRVNEDGVAVRVDEGVVTLTGRVDSWVGRSAAERNAFEAGAKDVRNLLSVGYGPVASLPAG